MIRRFVAFAQEIIRALEDALESPCPPFYLPELALDLARALGGRRGEGKGEGNGDKRVARIFKWQAEWAEEST